MADLAPDLVVVLSTLPDSERAPEIARALVEERLCACVNLVPKLRSIYRWEGAVQEATETLAIIKTTRAGYPALAARLAALHPYDVPEIVMLPADDVHSPYLAWVGASVG